MNVYNQAVSFHWSIKFTVSVSQILDSLLQIA